MPFGVHILEAPKYKKIGLSILFGLSENNIVLSETLPNSSVEVVAFISDTEPDSAPWINKNVAPVILLLLLPVARRLAPSKI